MIETPLHNRKTGETRWGDEGLFAEWADNPDVWMWAAFDNEALPHEKDVFLETFELPPLVIADAQRERHPPMLEVFDK